MKDRPEFPTIEAYLPEMMAFVAETARAYEAGAIETWDEMAGRVHAFFTPEMLDKVDAVAPGWRAMASYGGGVTLVHVMCVFTGLVLSPEFQQANAAQQALAKWTVLFHDVTKEVGAGRRDWTHGFRSAARTGATLPRLGFGATAVYDARIAGWVAQTETAVTEKEGAAHPIQDNDALPAILDGIDALFGPDSPAALVVKGVLLHMSINVNDDWPQAAPLSDEQSRAYVDAALWPLLRLMMLSDNDGWSLFEPETKRRFRQQTLAVFARLKGREADA